MTKNFSVGCFCLLATSCATTRPAAVQAPIRQVLTAQAAAWNRGDIPGFMQSYWHSDSLVFIGRKGPTYGWQQTLDNYRRGYPDAAAMGQLTFSGLHIIPDGPRAAHVVGRWHLARPTAGDVGGHFLLVFRQVKGQWVIAADHTNSE